MRYATTLLALVSVICVPVLARQSTSQHSLEGTWKVTEIVVTGEGAYVATQPQPSVFIFTKRHYQTAAGERQALCVKQGE